MRHSTSVHINKHALHANTEKAESVPSMAEPVCSKGRSLSRSCSSLHWGRADSGSASGLMTPSPQGRRICTSSSAAGGAASASSPPHLPREGGFSFRRLSLSVFFCWTFLQQGSTSEPTTCSCERLARHKWWSQTSLPPVHTLEHQPSLTPSICVITAFWTQSLQTIHLCDHCFLDTVTPNNITV